MRRVYAILFFLCGAYAFAQTCIVPAPVAPPNPEQLIIFLPPNGGTTGCTVSAIVPGAHNVTKQAISNAKCAQSVTIAKQAAAIDNGWNDGGTP